MKIKPLFMLFLFLTKTLYGVLDLEADLSDFVISSHRIEIPGFKDAFNPSIIKLKEGLLMSFRVIPGGKKTFNSEIGLIWLDDHYNPIGEPQFLDLTPDFADHIIPSRAEDARLVLIGKDVYIIYDDNRNEKVTKGGYRIYVAKLDIQENGKIEAYDIDVITQFEGENSNLREKSWVPFDYHNELLMAYSLSPHRIFRYLPLTGSCETFSETQPQVNWDWGILRGGTPGIKINENSYLSFFHSSKLMKSEQSDDKDMLHYFMGAYTFSTEPPFEIQQISSKPIVGKNFYNGEKYTFFWHPVRVVFPVGFILEEKIISVFYGRQDHELWVAHFDRQKLLTSLVEVNSSQ